MKKESLNRRIVCKLTDYTTFVFHAFFYLTPIFMLYKLSSKLWLYSVALLLILSLGLIVLTTSSKVVPWQNQVIQSGENAEISGLASATEEHEFTSLDIDLESAVSSMEESKLTLSSSAQLPMLVTMGLADMLENIDRLQVSMQSNDTIASQYDLLKSFLFENPEYAEDAHLLLSAYAHGSTQYRMLIAAIAGLPNLISGELLLGAVDEFKAQGSEQSGKQMVDLISALPAKEVSNDVMRALIDFGLDERPSLVLTLDIIALIDQSRLELYERKSLAWKLERNMEGASQNHLERIVPQLLSILPLEERANKALKFLYGTYSSDIKSLVLESVTAGIVPSSDKLKDLLLDLAANPDYLISAEISEVLKNEVALSEQEKYSLSL